MFTPVLLQWYLGIISNCVVTTTITITSYMGELREDPGYTGTRKNGKPHRFRLNRQCSHDRFGRPVIPQEWFCVPFERIEEAIERIKDKSIQNYRYDVKEAKLIKVHDTN